MKQKTIATRHLRTKIAAGYVLILLLIFGIVYIWLNEQQRRQEIETTSNKIRCFRKDVHEVYVKVVDLSLIGETVLDWNEEDMAAYHEKRLEVDTLLSRFKSTYRSERIDSVCRLLSEKEKLLNKIMLVLNEQEEIKDKIARRVPVIARKSSQEEPPKRKRTGFLGLFGKKEEAKPTVTTSMLNTLNSDVIARQKEQSERLSQYGSVDRHKVLSNTETRRHRVFRSCFEFLQKVFLGLMYPFSCVLWAIFWSFSLLFFVRQPAIFLITEAKMPQKLIPNHHTINSKQLLILSGQSSRRKV